MASNAVKTDVFFGEFGVGTLHNCAWTFIHEPPLSPPNFTQTSPSSMPLSHVIRQALILLKEAQKVM